MAKKHQSASSMQFKEPALSTVRLRGARTLESVAGELRMLLGTLKQWLKVPGSAQPVEPASLDGPARLERRPALAGLVGELCFEWPGATRVVPGKGLVRASVEPMASRVLLSSWER